MTREEIKKIIIEKTGFREVTPETNLSEIAQDSMTRIEILFAIEEMTGVYIPEEDIFSIETVGDLYKLVIGD